MAAIVTQIIGGAGTGKTEHLLREMEGCGRSPFEIGFVSFTRQAKRVAMERAAERFGIIVDELEHGGWFKTLHAICHRQLATGEGLLGDTSKDRKWIENAIDGKIDEEISPGDDALAPGAFEHLTDSGIALQLWDAARNSLSDYKTVWTRAMSIDGRTPIYEWCLDIVDKYEFAKRVDHRTDFVDLLARFAGYRFVVRKQDGNAWCEETEPEGAIPEVPIWCLDECQDQSALLHEVELRLTSNAEHIYCVGDPFQAIYGWAGSKAKHFLDWPYHERKTLPKSFRCAAPILELGERILTDCEGYWDRGIQPADHDGDVSVKRLVGKFWEQKIDPKESTLVLTRTNRQAAAIVRRLTAAGIPWYPTKGHGPWTAPSRNLGLQGLLYMQLYGGTVTRTWVRAIGLLPSVLERGGTKEPLLVRGIKSKVENKEFQPEDEWGGLISFDDKEVFEAAGGTPKLEQIIRSGEWRNLVDFAHPFCQAAEDHGIDLIVNPKVGVGTIHSAKGAEADNVFYLTTTTQQVESGRQDQQGSDEEARVSYVAVTRARYNLTIAVEPNERYRAQLPL